MDAYRGSISCWLIARGISARAALWWVKLVVVHIIWRAHEVWGVVESAAFQLKQAGGKRVIQGISEIMKNNHILSHTVLIVVFQSPVMSEFFPKSFLMFSTAALPILLNRSSAWTGEGHNRFEWPPSLQQSSQLPGRHRWVYSPKVWKPKSQSLPRPLRWRPAGRWWKTMEKSVKMMGWVF